MDVSFLILCPDKKMSGLKNTLGSIRFNSYNRESICIVGDNTDATEIKDFKELCETHKGGDTITSLINLGIKKIKTEWVFIIFAGSRIPTFIEKKLQMFAKQEEDVLFPVVEKKYDFVEGSFNGVMINKNFFKKVGEFQTTKMPKAGLTDFEFSKMLWAINALDHKVSFKAIVGMHII